MSNFYFKDCMDMCNNNGGCRIDGSAQNSGSG